MFCGEAWFQHRPPIDPSSLTRWRKRIGEAGLEWMLTQTIKAAESARVVKLQSFPKVIVDSTVQEKAIAHPTDSKLLEPARQHSVKLAAKAGLTLRQNYNREAPRLTVQVGRYAHAKQYKHMRASLKKLKTVVGRVWRDIERQSDKNCMAPARLLRDFVDSHCPQVIPPLMMRTRSRGYAARANF
ncbi:hypothetical protein ASF61_21860 [Duganella sp. Leaf126]|nr:hypothetical protein ASF61_21860 [Duganella sp. Leaf126]